MRKIFLFLMASCLVNLVNKQVLAQPAETETSPLDRNEVYWQRAKQLTEAQWLLLNRIDQAMVSADPKRVQAARGQLTLHLIEIDRFLRSSNRTSGRLCPSLGAKESELLTATRAGLEPAQAQLYCALYASSRELAPLGEILDRRAGILTSSAEVKPILLSREKLFNRQPESMSLLAPTVPASMLPVEKTPPLAVIGKPMKLLIADDVPVVAPAIAPVATIVKTLQASKQRLLALQNLVPTTARLMIPKLPLVERKLNEPYPGEVEAYQTFLAQPNTGITRLLPEEAYRVPANRLQNRLAPTPAEQYPFATISKGENGLPHQLALQVKERHFQMVAQDLDYGFLVDLGDVPIADLTALQPGQVPHAAETLRFFYTYRPPTELEAIQVDRRRFITGKVGNFRLTEPLLSQAPAAVNRTYLLRSIQYKLPDLLKTDRELTPLERRFLKDALNVPASDVLVAFRPISRRLDGSYTVLWRVLAQFPNPTISDLEQYVSALK